MMGGYQSYPEFSDDYIPDLEPDYLEDSEGPVRITEPYGDFVNEYVWDITFTLSAGSATLWNTDIRKVVGFVDKSFGDIELYAIGTDRSNIIIIHSKKDVIDLLKAFYRLRKRLMH